MTPKRFRLQISVASGFAILMLAMLALAVGLFHQANTRVALNTARQAMAQAQLASETALMGVIAPVGRIVETTAAVTAAFPEAVREPQAFGAMDAQIRDLPQVYSLYVGFADAGSFVQVARLDPGATVFGAAAIPVPAGTARVWRSIRQNGAARTQYVTFLDANGRATSSVQRGSTFDPRQRDWYQDALTVDHPVVSPIYTFFSTGRPGLTVSLRVADGKGDPFAVAGADMSLSAITAVLQSVRTNGIGETFLLSKKGDLIASSEPTQNQRPGRLTAMAIDTWRASGKEFFRMTAPGSEEVQLVSVGPTAPFFGNQPLFGVIVPESHFTGEIVETTRRVIWLTGLLALVTLAGTIWLARLLSASLAQVADQARRISAFDLEGRFDLASRIVEVHDLGAAVGNMKNSLRSFSAYVPKDVVRTIVAAGGAAEVGGTTREVSLMFSDIENFTAKSEHLPPEVVTAELSRYFAAMHRAVAQHHGTVDKYIGDAVMALWNAPAEDADHAANACRAALACRAAERALTAGTEGATLFPTRTRIGLHTDRVVVGNVGSPERLQYTAIGGAVNLASRVEGLNKVYGTDILATGAIVDRVGARFLFRPVDLVAPAGTSEPVNLFELVGETGPEALHPVPDAVQQELAAWAAALALYRQRDWTAAQAAFADLKGETSRDGLVALYLQRCADHLVRPPPPGWTGIHVFDHK